MTRMIIKTQKRLSNASTIAKIEGNPLSVMTIGIGEYYRSSSTRGLYIHISAVRSEEPHPVYRIIVVSDMLYSLFLALAAIGSQTGVFAYSPSVWLYQSESDTLPGPSLES
jgi:hypothetical protein